MAEIKDELERQFRDWVVLTPAQILRIIRAPGISIESILEAKGGSDKIAGDLRIAAWRLSAGSARGKGKIRSEIADNVRSTWLHCVGLIDLLRQPEISHEVDSQFDAQGNGHRTISGIDISDYALQRGIGGVSTFTNSLKTDLEVALEVLNQVQGFKDVEPPEPNYNIDDFIEDLMDIYRVFFDKTPSVSYRNFIYSGPFLRFASAALKATGSDLPNSTIHSKWKAIKKSRKQQK